MQFVEQSRVLDGDDRRSGEVLDQIDLLVAEGADFLTKDGDRADPAGDELAEEALFGVEARCGFDAFGRRARSPLGMILERLFMIPPRN